MKGLSSGTIKAWGEGAQSMRRWLAAALVAWIARIIVLLRRQKIYLRDNVDDTRSPLSTWEHNIPIKWPSLKELMRHIYILSLS